MPRLTIVWHGAVHAEYRRPFQLLHEGEWDVTLIAPRSWRLVLPSEVEYQASPTETFAAHILEPKYTWHAVTHSYRRLWRSLRASHPGVVFAYEEPYSWITYRLLRWCRARRIPFVAKTCQDIHKIYPAPFRWMENAVLRNATMMLGLNRNCIQVLRRKGYKGPAHVVPASVDVERYRSANAPLRPPGYVPVEKDKTFLIGYVGRLVHEKGVDLLLEALPRLPSKYRLAVAGDGPQKKILEALARGLGIAERVVWLGAVPHAELPDVYAALDVLVLPSRTQRNWQEQFGRVLVEGMAAGVPVVATHCGAIPEVVGDAGILVQEETSHAIADAVRVLCENPEARDRFKAKGLERVTAMYTHEHVADLYNSIFRDALQREPAGEVSI